MSADEKRELRKLVDASGYVFQLAVEHLIQSTRDEHGWAIVTREHPWSHDGNEGFTDIVLAKGIMRLVVECKRVRDGAWVFLVLNTAHPTKRFRCQWAHGMPGRKDLVGWTDLGVEPESREAQFCHIRGKGEDQKSTLERIAAKLVNSCNPLALEELLTMSWTGSEHAYVYIPLVVTTATLHECRFDPATVDVTVGQLGDAEFEAVSLTRFRKSLVHPLSYDASLVDLTTIAADKERSVLVTSPAGLPALLKEINLIRLDRFTGLPWEVARKRETLSA